MRRSSADMGCSRLQRCVSAAFLLLFCLSLVSSLVFHVSEGEQRCFIEKLPEKNKLIGDFWTRLFDEQTGEYLPAPQDLSVSVIATDPHHQLVLTRQERSNGTFSFTSSESGEHRVCLQPSSSQRPLSAGLVLVVGMDLRSADRIDDHTQILRLNDLTRLQLRVQQLTDQVQQIQKELGHLKELENDFRHINHSTNMWIFWWPVLRSIYVVVYVISFTSAW